MTAPSETPRTVRRIGSPAAAALADQAGIGDDPELRGWALEAVRPKPQDVTGPAL